MMNEKTLHIFLSPPDEETRELAGAWGAPENRAEVHLYGKTPDYDRLLDLILEHDRTITWR